ncbi:hypothetical protein Tco_0765030 [Tanacetum coccineum]
MARTSHPLPLDFFFFDLDFQCPPPLSLLSESASVYLEWERWLWLSESADTLFPLLPNLLNAPPSFSLDFCLGDLDRSRLILENTLGLGLGLRDRLDLCLFSCSLVLIVLDSEYRDVPEHPSKYGFAQRTSADLRKCPLEAIRPSCCLRTIASLKSCYTCYTSSTAKLRNGILMLQQHQGESLSEAQTRFKGLTLKVPHHGIDLWLQNDPRDFAKPVKAISLPKDVPSTSVRHLVELENQVQRLMEAHLAPKQPVQVNKITSSCEICSGPHGTQYCMEHPEQAFVEYASSHTDEARGKWYTFKPEQNNLGDTYNPL